LKEGAGGTSWDAITYDPELNLIYFGTGNGVAWDRDERSPGGGDNLYLTSILAVFADTGKVKWHYQLVPGDTWTSTPVSSSCSPTSRSTARCGRC